MPEGNRSLHSTTRGGTSGGPREETDAQVAQIRNDPRPPSLCDVAIEELMEGRHPERPIVSRIAIVGEIAVREEPLRNTLESLIGIATRRVNAEDPSGGLLRTRVATAPAASAEGASPTGAAPAASAPATTVQTSTVGITGVCVEYQRCFAAVFESEPAHLMELMRCLKGRLVDPAAAQAAAAEAKGSSSVAGGAAASKVAKSGSVVDVTQHPSGSSVAGSSAAPSAAAAAQQKRTALDRVHIMYQVDDIITKGTTLYTHIDASSLDGASKGGAAAAAGGLLSAVPLDSQVVKAVYNMLSLGAHAQGLSSKAMREHFSTGAASTHAKLLPPQALIAECAKGDLCLSVEEFLAVFGALPTVTRDKEMVNPLEPPLQY